MTTTRAPRHSPDKYFWYTDDLKSRTVALLRNNLRRDSRFSERNGIIVGLQGTTQDEYNVLLSTDDSERSATRSHLRRDTTKNKLLPRS